MRLSKVISIVFLCTLIKESGAQEYQGRSDVPVMEGSLEAGQGITYLTANMSFKYSTTPPTFIQDPSYLIMTPRLVKAGKPYRAVVNILAPYPPHTVLASLLKANIQVDTTVQICENNAPQIIEIKVPDASTDGDYKLVLEGNEVGSLAGSSFVHEKSLMFRRKDVLLSIHLDKALYKLGSIVRFRVLVLDSSFKTSQESVDIYVHNPRGIIVKKWLSKQSQEGGLISLSVSISGASERGEWQIRAQSFNYTAQKDFVVEDYHESSFEMRVETPAFLSSAEEFLEGSVIAYYTSGDPLAGNISVRVAIRSYESEPISFVDPEHILINNNKQFSGSFSFKYRLADFKYLMSPTGGIEIMIAATVVESKWGATEEGYSRTRIFNPRARLNFLGESPQIFRPSMPFQFYLTASQMDGSRLPRGRLRHHKLLVYPEVEFEFGRKRPLYPRQVKMSPDQIGFWEDEIDLDSELGQEENVLSIVSLKLEAELKDAIGSKSFASLMAVKYYSPGGHFIQLSTSTKNPKVGEYIILHVRTNFFANSFRYILTSKGIIIDAGQEKIQASLKTFTLVVTEDMSGSATLIVYVMERGGSLVTDSLTFHVDSFSRNTLSVSLKYNVTEDTVKLELIGQPDSIVVLAGTTWDAFLMSSGNLLDEESIERSLETFDPDDISEVPLQVKWKTHFVSTGDTLALPKSSHASDANQTFGLSDLSLLTDWYFDSRPTPCRVSRGFLPCLLGGCYPLATSCDKKWDCVDRIDERKCEPYDSDNHKKEVVSFNTFRKSRNLYSYDDPWLWTVVNLGKNGRKTLTMPSPDESPRKLVLTAFSAHPDKGLALLQQPVVTTTSPRFKLGLDAPKVISHWEQVGLHITLRNTQEKPLSGVLVLARSSKYKFISIRDFEEAQPDEFFHIRRQPQLVKRMIEGHQRKIYVPSMSSVTINMPIVAMATGDLLVSVEAIFPIGKKKKSISIHVQPGGAAQEHHTSMLLDLNNRGYLFTFLDLKIPEVSGNPSSSSSTSASAHASLFGGTVGRLSTGNVFSSAESLGLPQEGSESLASEMLLTLMQFRHWKILGQEPTRSQREISKDLRLLLLDLLAYQHDDGGFKPFRMSRRSSIWLTSLVLRVLNLMSSQWSDYVDVDAQVFDKALRFVMKNQAPHGSFWEETASLGPRYLESSNSFSLTHASTKGLNLSSTAFTLVQLAELVDIPKDLSTNLDRTLSLGREWLETNFDLVSHASGPLEIALLVLALHLLESGKRDDAFSLLARNVRQESSNYAYWGEDLVPPPSYRVEEQRSHLQPRRLNKHDSANIAATACALRVYATRGEKDLSQSIVRWLHSQRVHDSGWMSTLDTLLAWESLFKHSLEDEEVRQTRLTVTVEAMVVLSSPHVFHVTPSNVLTLQRMQLGPRWGNLRVQGKGKGSAVLQLSSKYYVTDESQLVLPKEQAFSLHTNVIASGDNASTLSMEICASWNYTSVSDTSGVAVLEAAVPSGYYVASKWLSNYVLSGDVPDVIDITFKPRLLTVYFEKLGRLKRCIKIPVKRRYPVANLTRILPIKIYEFYSPELMTIKLLDMSSVTLDICQVCGSYQCPNCPMISYYSSTASSSSVSEEKLPLFAIFTTALLQCLLYSNFNEGPT